MRKCIQMATVLMMALGMWAALPSAALAQQDVEDKPVTIDVVEADIRDVVKLLCDSVGVNYLVDAAVTGTVTITVKEQPFRSVLESVVKQVGATLRVSAGMYQIVPRQEIQISQNETPDFIAPTAKPRLQRIKIMHADPQFIHLILRGRAGFSTQPEISALQRGGGGGAGGIDRAAGAGSSDDRA